MKTAFVTSLLVASAAAFAPAPMTKVSCFWTGYCKLKMKDMELDSASKTHRLENNQKNHMFLARC